VAENLDLMHKTLRSVSKKPDKSEKLFAKENDQQEFSTVIAHHNASQENLLVEKTSVTENELL
jgi:hypothetical protein